MTRELSRGSGLGEAWHKLHNIRPTEAEQFADRAARANLDYIRYRKAAREKIRFCVSRTADSVRIDREHKWGPQPFHYRKRDYQSISREIENLYRVILGRPEGEFHGN